MWRCSWYQQNCHVIKVFVVCGFIISFPPVWVIRLYVGHYYESLKSFLLLKTKTWKLTSVNITSFGKHVLVVMKPSQYLSHHMSNVSHFRDLETLLEVHIFLHWAGLIKVVFCLNNRIMEPRRCGILVPDIVIRGVYHCLWNCCIHQLFKPNLRNFLVEKLTQPKQNFHMISVAYWFYLYVLVCNIYVNILMVVP